jgi:signal peptidase II
MPERDGARREVKFALIALAAVANLVLADAVVKELSAGFLKAKAAVAVIPGFFNLAYVENRGCAWGMFQGHVWPLAVFGLAALGFIIWKRRSVFGEGKAARFAEILLYAGIIGNLIDRICRGYVIDMFDFYVGNSHFPCFNLADSYISVAAGIMILCSFGKRTC